MENRETVEALAKSLRRAGANGDDAQLLAWARRAAQAYDAYASETDEACFDEDDACEAVLAAFEDEEMDEDAMQETLLRLSAFMDAVGREDG